MYLLHLCVCAKIFYAMEVGQPSTMEVEEPSAMKVEESSAKEVEEPSAMEVEEPSRREVEEPSTREVGDPSAVMTPAGCHQCQRAGRAGGEEEETMSFTKCICCICVCENLNHGSTPGGALGAHSVPVGEDPFPYVHTGLGSLAGGTNITQKSPPQWKMKSPPQWRLESPPEWRLESAPQ